MWFLLKVCIHIYIGTHVYVHTRTHVSMTRLAAKFLCLILLTKVFLFYEGFVLWELLAQRRWKLFKQEVWAQSFPAGFKTVRGQKPEISHIAMRIYVKKKNHFSSPSPGFMKLNLAAPSCVSLA